MESQHQSASDNPPKSHAGRADMGVSSFSDPYAIPVPIAPLAYPASIARVRMHLSAGEHLPISVRSGDLPGPVHPNLAADAPERRRPVHAIAIINVQGAFPPGGLAANTYCLSFSNPGRAQGGRHGPVSWFRHMAIVPAITSLRQTAHPDENPGARHSAHHPPSGSPSACQNHSANHPNASTAAHAPGARPRRAAQLIVARAGNPPPE